MTRRSHRHLGPALVAFRRVRRPPVAGAIGGRAAHRYGVKSDEATYVAMALSVAHDGDLTYEKGTSNGSPACITADRTASS